MTSDEEALFAQLEGVFAKVDEEGVEDLNDLSNEELVQKMADLEVFIRDKNQLLHPREQSTRDAHSELNAVQLILQERMA